MAVTPQQKRKEVLGQSMIQSLERRNFEAYYCNTAKEAVEKALSLMPKGSSVSWGGSVTIRESGLTKACHEGGYQVIDRDLASNPEEMYELHRQGLLADFFLTSANAISEDGELVNVDGNGNRVAAMSFGPKNVIMLIGLNKVAQNLETAISRARSYAAPINSMRFMGNTPCAVTGKCHDCTTTGCVCSQILITRMSKPPKRTKVILIGEDFGF